MKVFVQGDREAKGCVAIAGLLAQEFIKNDIEVNLGAYGKLVKIFIEAGCRAICHGYRDDRGHCPEEIEFINCHRYALADQDILASPKEAQLATAWGIRMGILMANSDAFVFFSGREGTLAHFFPILAFTSKHQAKPVAMINWPIYTQNNSVTRFMFPPNGLKPEWVRHFTADEIDEIVPFLSQTFHR